MKQIMTISAALLFLTIGEVQDGIEQVSQAYRNQQ